MGDRRMYAQKGVKALVVWSWSFDKRPLEKVSTRSGFYLDLLGSLFAHHFHAFVAVWHVVGAGMAWWLGTTLESPSRA